MYKETVPIERRKEARKTDKGTLARSRPLGRLAGFMVWPACYRRVMKCEGFLFF
jgi:hypothetical protein